MTQPENDELRILRALHLIESLPDQTDRVIAELMQMARAGNIEAGFALADILSETPSSTPSEKVDGWAISASDLGYHAPLLRLAEAARTRGDRPRTVELTERLNTNRARLPERTRSIPHNKDKLLPEAVFELSLPSPPRTSAPDREVPPQASSPVKLKRGWPLVAGGLAAGTMAMAGAALYLFTGLPEKTQPNTARLKDVASVQPVPAPVRVVVPEVPEPVRPSLAPADQPAQPQKAEIDEVMPDAVMLSEFPRASDVAQSRLGQMAREHMAAMEEAFRAGDAQKAAHLATLALEAAFSNGDLDLIEHVLDSADRGVAREVALSKSWPELRDSMHKGVSYSFRMYHRTRDDIREDLTFRWIINTDQAETCRIQAEYIGLNDFSYDKARTYDLNFFDNFGRHIRKGMSNPDLRWLATMEPERLAYSNEAVHTPYDGTRYLVCEKCPAYVLHNDGFAMSFQQKSDTDSFQQSLGQYLDAIGCD